MTEREAIEWRNELDIKIGYTFYFNLFYSHDDDSLT